MKTSKKGHTVPSDALTGLPLTSIRAICQNLMAEFNPKQPFKQQTKPWFQIHICSSQKSKRLEAFCVSHLLSSPAFLHQGPLVGLGQKFVHRLHFQTVCYSSDLYHLPHKTISSIQKCFQLYEKTQPHFWQICHAFHSYVKNKQIHGKRKNTPGTT